MGDFLVFERFVWFDTQVRKKRFPNAGKLADHFELSRKTSQRSIHFMRDCLLAPLEYDRSKKGYFYLDETFELPHFIATQEEILSTIRFPESQIENPPVRLRFRGDLTGGTSTGGAKEIEKMAKIYK